MIRWPRWLFPSRRPSNDFKNRVFVEQTFAIQVNDPELYELASIHRSSGFPMNNERLELLGDAVLDLVLTDYLYRVRPEASEGHITRLRSKIVSRTHLSRMAALIGLSTEFSYQKQHDLPDELIMGNALEALMGAIYLDQGHDVVHRVILDLLEKYVILEELENELVDPKSRLLEWAQAEKRHVRFVTNPQGKGKDQGFESDIILDGEIFAQGQGRSKKSAEKDASADAWKRIAENPSRQ